MLFNKTEINKGERSSTYLTCPQLMKATVLAESFDSSILSSLYTHHDSLQMCQVGKTLFSPIQQLFYELFATCKGKSK